MIKFHRDRYRGVLLRELEEQKYFFFIKPIYCLAIFVVVSESEHDTNTFFSRLLGMYNKRIETWKFLKQITGFLTLKSAPASQPKMELFVGEITRIFDAKRNLLRF